MAKETPQREDRFYNKLGVPLSSLTTAWKVIELNRHNPQNIVCLVGEAGLGKSQLVIQIGAARAPGKSFTWGGKVWENAVPVIILYLAHIQAEDVGGVPYPSHAKRNELLTECDLFLRIASMEDTKGALRKRASKHALDLAQVVLESGDPLKNGTFEYLIEKTLKDLPPEGILFLDEWNRADKAVIKAFFTLLEDRKIHGIPLVPEGVQIVAAMNPSDGTYSVNEAEKDHAFRRRLCFTAVTTNVGAWLKYAGGPGEFHPQVVEFIKSMPAALYDTKLRDAGKAFPCPANWEKVSNLLYEAERLKVNLNGPEIYTALAGHIGEATGSLFHGFIKDNQTVISPNEVLTAYKEKSAVRKKVQAMIADARNDVINELCTGISLVLMTEQPDVQKTSRFLARFFGDLMPEQAIAMISNQMNAAATGIEGAEAYLNQLSEELHKHPAYGELFTKLGSAMKRGRHEAEGSTDPF